MHGLFSGHRVSIESLTRLWDPIAKGMAARTSLPNHLEVLRPALIQLRTELNG
jgi:hypothetical protein